MSRSKPHGEKDFTYHPHKVEDPDHYRNEIDRIFKKGKYAADTAAAPEPPKLQLEVGKRYVRRDGEVTGPLEDDDCDEYPFFDYRWKVCYTSTGAFYNDAGSSQFDLVREYVDEAAPEPSESPDVKHMGAVTISRNGYVERLEVDLGNASAHRDLLVAAVERRMRFAERHFNRSQVEDEIDQQLRDALEGRGL